MLKLKKKPIPLEADDKEAVRTDIVVSAIYCLSIAEKNSSEERSSILSHWKWYV